MSLISFSSQVINNLNLLLILIFYTLTLVVFFYTSDIFHLDDLQSSLIEVDMDFLFIVAYTFLKSDLLYYYNLITFNDKFLFINKS